MAVPLNQMPLPGSALATPSARCLGPLPPLEQLDVVVRLHAPVRSDDVAAVVRFAVGEGLRVLDVDHRGAAVDLRGSVLALSQAFGAQLRRYVDAEGPFRARRGMLWVPVHLAGVIAAIDGFDERPGRPVRLLAPPTPPAPGPRPAGRTAPPTPSFPSSSLSVPAAPRARVGRACADRAGDPGSSEPTLVAGEDHEPVVPGGCDGVPAPTGLAVVLHLPSRPAPAPPDHDARRLHPSAGGPPVSLAPARTRRRGPMARAAAEQHERRLARLLARQLHPAGNDAP